MTPPICPVCHNPSLEIEKEGSTITYGCTCYASYPFSTHTFVCRKDDMEIKTFSIAINPVQILAGWDGWFILLGKSILKQTAIAKGEGMPTIEEAYKIFQRYRKLLAFT